VVVRFVDIGGIVDNHCLNFMLTRRFKKNVNRCRKTNRHGQK